MVTAVGSATGASTTTAVVPVACAASYPHDRWKQLKLEDFACVLTLTPRDQASTPPVRASTAFLLVRYREGIIPDL